jgi:hypothetical protein
MAGRPQWDGRDDALCEPRVGPDASLVGGDRRRRRSSHSSRPANDAVAANSLTGVELVF